MTAVVPGTRYIKQGGQLVALGAGGGDVLSPLERLHARLAQRTAGAVNIAFTGSSTTEGYNASAAAKRYVNLLTAMLQAAYPSGTGSEPAVVAHPDANFGTPATTPGVHAYNAGQAGTRAESYFQAGERTTVAALNPVLIVHMNGSNDYAQQRPIATFKADMAAVITDVKSKLTQPCLQVLVHSYQRMDVANPTIPWSAYGRALAELADADPSNVLFVDLSGLYVPLGVPGADPANLIDTDNVHGVDASHQLLAEGLRLALQVPAIAAPTTTPPPGDTAAPIISSFTATAGDGQVALAWSGSDNVAVTNWTISRGGTQIYSGTGTSFTDTGRTNGTTYSYVLTATDAAGNTATANASATPAAAGGGAPTVLAADNFERADGPLGTAPTGQVWTGANFAITGGRAAGSDIAYLSAGQADMDVAADVTILMSGTIGITANILDNGNRITLYVLNGVTVTLGVTVGGALNVVGGGQTLTIGQTYRFRLVSKGATITAFVDGVQVATHTLTSAEQVLKTYSGAGLRQGGTAGGYFDAFEVKTPA